MGRLLIDFFLVAWAQLILYKLGSWFVLLLVFIWCVFTFDYGIQIEILNIYLL